MVLLIIDAAACLVDAVAFIASAFAVAVVVTVLGVIAVTVAH